MPGLPDLEVIVKGKTYYFECKDAGGSPKKGFVLDHPFTPTQYKHGYLIKRAGGRFAGLVKYLNRVFVIPVELVRKGNIMDTEIRGCRYFTVACSQAKNKIKEGVIWDVGSLIETMDDQF